jgi:hypothetical protein
MSEETQTESIGVSHEQQGVNDSYFRTLISDPAFFVQQLPPIIQDIAEHPLPEIVDEASSAMKQMCSVAHEVADRGREKLIYAIYRPYAREHGLVKTTVSEGPLKIETEGIKPF